jgi:hypothetical protein
MPRQQLYYIHDISLYAKLNSGVSVQIIEIKNIIFHSIAGIERELGAEIN